MVKIHTRVKRKMRMYKVSKKSSLKGHKTFKSEEAAKNYAEKKGIKKFTLVDLQPYNPKRTKIKIVVE